LNETQIGFGKTQKLLECGRSTLKLKDEQKNRSQKQEEFWLKRLGRIWSLECMKCGEKKRKESKKYESALNQRGGLLSLSRYFCHEKMRETAEAVSEKQD
jgi:hypothetical protein